MIFENAFSTLTTYYRSQKCRKCSFFCLLLVTELFLLTTGLTNMAYGRFNLLPVPVMLQMFIRAYYRYEISGKCSFLYKNQSIMLGVTYFTYVLREGVALFPKLEIMLLQRKALTGDAQRILLRSAQPHFAITFRNHISPHACQISKDLWGNNNVRHIMYVAELW